MNNLEIYKKTVNFLKERSYTPKGEKPHTYLLKSMADNTSIGDVKDALNYKTSETLKFTKIDRFKTRMSIKYNSELPIFLTQISPERKVQEMYEIKSIHFQKIKWEWGFLLKRSPNKILHNAGIASDLGTSARIVTSSIDA